MHEGGGGDRSLEKAGLTKLKTDKPKSPFLPATSVTFSMVQRRYCRNYGTVLTEEMHSGGPKPLLYIRACGVFAMLIGGMFCRV